MSWNLHLCNATMRWMGSNLQLYYLQSILAIDLTGSWVRESTALSFLRYPCQEIATTRTTTQHKILPSHPSTLRNSSTCSSPRRSTPNFHHARPTRVLAQSPSQIVLIHHAAALRLTSPFPIHSFSYLCHIHLASSLLFLAFDCLHLSSTFHSAASTSFISSGCILSNVN